MRMVGVILISTVLGPPAFGWGEGGHHLAARLAARLVALHPTMVDLKSSDQTRGRAFSELFEKKRMLLGHLGSVPDTYWRNLPGPVGRAVEELNKPTHYFHSDARKMPVTLAYPVGDQNFFADQGHVPWRTQQFYLLLKHALSQYPAKCDASANPSPSIPVLAYAGLLTHFVSDSAQPYHATVDFDGEAVGQSGIHWYFENDLFEALDPGIEAKVAALAKQLLTARAVIPRSLKYFQSKTASTYPDAKTDEKAIALNLVLLQDSLLQLPKVAALDKKHDIVTGQEARDLGCDPQKICRRPARDTAKHFEAILVDRLAVAAVLIADLWVQAWLEAGKPMLCDTRQYAFRPNFVSPKDPGCLGYAISPKATAPKDCLTSW